MNESVLKIIEKLKDKTEANQAIWIKTSIDDEFKLDLTKGAITSSFWIDEDGNNANFSILNEDGNPVEKIFVMEKDDAKEFKILYDLYNVINKSYLKVDQTINTIFDELNSDKTVGRDTNLL